MFLTMQSAPLTQVSAATGATPIAISQGYMIDRIVFINKSTNEALLSAGVTLGGSELFFEAIVSPNTLNGGYTVQAGNFIPDPSAGYTLYIDGTWNGAIVDIKVLLKKIA